MIWWIVVAVAALFGVLYVLDRWLGKIAARRTPPFADHEHTWRVSPDDDPLGVFRRCALCGHTDWQFGNEWTWVHPQRDPSLMASANRALASR